MKKIFGSWQGKKLEQPYTIRNSIEWIQSGNRYYDILEELINSSRSEIHIQTYILDPDQTGNRIIDALIRAAERKIQVFIIVDAYGSQNLKEPLIQLMKDSGIHFRKYGELYSNGRFHIGRRMHHKISVFDGYTSIVGGINISDNYNDTPEGRAWLDFAVIMRGDISRRLQFVCRRRWKGWSFSFKSRKDLLKNSAVGKRIKEICQIRIRRNDFVRNKHDITISYRQAFRNSEKSILLVGGYFLPGGRTRRLMKRAIERGVKIDVIVSEKSDVKIVLFARRYLYNWLIRNHIGVYEYKPANVHGKVLISDNKWSSIGSYDLNNLSTYSNIELNVDISSAEFSSRLSAHVHKIMLEDCEKVPGENSYNAGSVFNKFQMWCAYRFVKTLFVLSVLLAGKREKEF